MRVCNLEDLLTVLTPKVFNDIIFYKMGIEYTINDDSWEKLGFDDLDEVEFIMEIEKRCDCFIADEFADKMYREVSPKTLYNLLMRNNNLDALGI